MSQDLNTGMKEPVSSRAALRSYRRMMLLVGFSILLVSFLVGICLSFVQWDRGSPFEAANWGHFNPLGRATYGPLIFAAYVFPVTLPLLLIPSLLVYFGLRKQTLWPFAVLGFVATAVFWLFWITELWKMD